ncbi:MAG: flagellar assembly protein FliW [Deltaproteobacteria bacterium]|nr:flagellar assembly protein FliW [Deltaproteobacteria bacterium]
MPENTALENLVIQTTRFGQISVPQANILCMPQGMIGFPERRRFALLRHRDKSPFQWLQCVDQPDLAFVVVTPLVFDPKYEFKLGQAETNLLEVADPSQIQVWVVVNIPHGHPEKMTGNLKAPVVINLANNLAAQVILDDQRYGLRHTLAPPPAKSEAPPAAGKNKTQGA